MRKIQTQADIDRKKRKNQILVGVVLIGLMLVSVIGYSFNRSDDDKDTSKVSENGVDFFKQNSVWVAEIDGNVFSFQNLPSEVADVDVNVSIGLGEYSGQPLYFVNPNEGASEILNNIGRYVLRYQESCLWQDSGIRGRESEVGDLSNLALKNESEFICEGDLPIKDCDDNLIIFESGNVTEVYQDRGCIFVVGDSLRATDAFLYKVLQIL